jgi:hypothetical protein
LEWSIGSWITILRGLTCRRLRFRQRAGLFDPDGGKAVRRDAQRQRSSVIITAPGRQHTASGDFLDQSIGQEFADRLLGKASLRALRRVNGAVLALSGGGQQHQLRVGKFVR